MKRWIHASTRSVEGASANDLYPINDPEWVYDESSDSKHYDLIDPAYGWATIYVYRSSKDGVNMHTVYRADVKPNNELKMGRAFNSFEMASRWAESQLYEEYAPIESSTNELDWEFVDDKSYDRPRYRLSNGTKTAIVIPYDGYWTAIVDSGGFIGDYQSQDFKSRNEAYEWAEDQLGLS